MKLVPIQRTGAPVFQWDAALDRGHRFSEGETLMVSESCAAVLSGTDGWVLPASPETNTELEG
jgi:hypothetical protein